MPESSERKQAIDIETVYCKYYRRVFLWCSRVVRNTEDAEDLTHDAFVHVMRKIHTYRGEAAFSTWLFRVVMNTVFMQLRRKRLPQNSLDEVLDFGEGTLRSRDALGVIDSAFGDTDARVDLVRAVAQMPTGFKVVFLLHDLEDYSHSEIAEIRGWTVGTSKSQLHKARGRLRELLADPGRDSGCISRGGAGENWPERGECHAQR
jgi:RNA polymerase sigma-70 factor (ECF subfamily)